MACRLPILTVLILLLILGAGEWAKSQDVTTNGVVAEEAGSPSTTELVGPQAAALLAKARQQIDEHDSISTRVRCRAEVFDRSIVGAGAYIQGPQRFGWIRWDLKLQIGDRSASMQQIADGRSLWIHRQFDRDSSIQRVDLGRLPRDDALQMPAPSFMPAGGLPELLRALQQSFDFTAAIPAVVDGRDVWAVRGEWKATSLARLFASAGIDPGKQPSAAALPAELPDQVMLLLGREDLFPYRVEYRRVRTAQGSAPVGAGKSLLTIEWLDVVIDAPIDRSLFVFDPADEPVEDRTAHFIASMRHWPK